MPEQDRNPAADRDDAYRAAPLLRDEHSEPTFTRLIEQQAARIPSHWFLAAALAAMGVSVVCEFTGRRRWGRFVGMWPGPLLITGVYNASARSPVRSPLDRRTRSGENPVRTITPRPQSRNREGRLR